LIHERYLEGDQFLEHREVLVLRRNHFLEEKLLPRLLPLAQQIKCLVARLA
jgi:hypothetical protein